MNELLRTILALPEQASSMAREIDLLHYAVIIISMLGATFVAAAVAVLLLRYRDTAPVERVEQAEHHELHPGHAPLSLEIGVIAGLLGLFVLFWVIGFRQYVRLQRPPTNAMPIYVVAKQWMWAFAYPDGTISNGELYVPVGRPVKLIMTSRDVIHSFFVPAFRIKQDVIPGRATTVWFEAVKPGEYDVLCTEYCGGYHSTMRAKVIALPPEQLARLAETRRPAVDLAEIGEQVAAERGCLRCHTVDGTPHLGPTWAGLYGSRVPVLGRGPVLVDEAYLTRSMMQPNVDLHEGFPPIMPSYFGVLDAAESAALVEYIRTLAGLPRLPPAPPIPGGAP